VLLTGIALLVASVALAHGAAAFATSGTAVSDLGPKAAVAAASTSAAMDAQAGIASNPAASNLASAPPMGPTAATGHVSGTTAASVPLSPLSISPSGAHGIAPSGAAGAGATGDARASAADPTGLVGAVAKGATTAGGRLQSAIVHFAAFLHVPLGEGSGSASAGAWILPWMQQGQSHIQNVAAHGVVAHSAPAAAASLAASALVAHVLGAFYSRIPRSKVLDHPSRQRLLSLVREKPGMNLLEAQAALGIGWGTLIHHVARLESEGFLVSDKANGHRLFAAGSFSPADRARVGLAASPQRTKILEYLVANPGAQQKEVCEALGLSASVASKHLAKLREGGLVAEERAWRSVRYSCAEWQPSSPAPSHLGSVVGPPAAAPAPPLLVAAP
jgi:DNA-binding transcriptional ArsR family regulator